MNGKIIIWIDGKPVEASLNPIEIPSSSHSVTGSKEYSIVFEGLFQPTWTTSKVECPLCTKQWVAVYPDGTDVLECPNCGNMVDPIIIQTEE